jgi:hypothetical protein
VCGFTVEGGAEDVAACEANVQRLHDAEARQWRELSLRPATTLAQRSQKGKVVINDCQVAVQALEVVAEDGSAYPLDASGAVTLPLQVVVVQAAA